MTPMSARRAGEPPRLRDSAERRTWPRDGKPVVSAVPRLPALDTLAAGLEVVCEHRAIRNHARTVHHPVGSFRRFLGMVEPGHKPRFRICRAHAVQHGLCQRGVEFAGGSAGAAVAGNGLGRKRVEQAEARRRPLPARYADEPPKPGDPRKYASGALPDVVGRRRRREARHAVSVPRSPADGIRMGNGERIAVRQRPGLDREKPYLDAMACAFRDDAAQPCGAPPGLRVLGTARRLREFAEAHRYPQPVHAFARNLGEELICVVVGWLEELVAVVGRALYRRRRAARYAVPGPVFSHVREGGRNDGQGCGEKNLHHIPTILPQRPHAWQAEDEASQDARRDLGGLEGLEGLRRLRGWAG